MAEVNPISREELYLAKAAGMDVETPRPISRKELFLQKIIDRFENGGLGSGENVDLTGVVKSDTIATIWTGTQAEYDAITEKSDTTLYMIKEVV